MTLLVAGAACVLLSGCAATQVALEHKDLKVQTQMSKTIFLDVEKPAERTVFLDIKNTSDREVNVEPLIRQRLEAKGYKIVSNPQQAFYILQVNILQVGVSDPSALQSSLYAGWGGPVHGAVLGGTIGAAAGGARGLGYGSAAGGLAGSAAELVSGSLVKNVTYSMITDVQVVERTDELVSQTVKSNLEQGTGTQVLQTSESVRERRKYQTRIVSTANKVNLKFEQALPILEEQLAKSIAGIL
jgi:hypothetical protein